MLRKFKFNTFKDEHEQLKINTVLLHETVYLLLVNLLPFAIYDFSKC